jgi:hypothetical protein
VKFLHDVERCIQLRALCRAYKLALATHAIDIPQCNGGFMNNVMNDTSSAPFSFALLVDPASIQAVVERAAQWNLPRRICRPLDRRAAPQGNAEVAAYDAAVDLAEVEPEAPTETTAP